MARKEKVDKVQTNHVENKAFVHDENVIGLTNEKAPIEKEKVLEKTAEPQVAKDDAKPKYKVFGQDITLSDGDIIDYYRTRMKIMVMRFMLVGRIDDNGNYKIKDEIKYDLIRMNKEISDSGEDFYRAEARYITKLFYFNIKIEMMDSQKAKASLYLSEFVDDFLEDEYIISHIADYTDTYDEQFRIKVRQAFNLHDAAIKNDEFKMPALAVLMSDEYDINEYIGGLYDLASQIYVMRMLKLLEESGDPNCLEIIKRYKELTVDKDENDVNEKYKFTKFKALLDRAIDEKGGLEKLNVNKEALKSIVNEVNKSVKAIDGVQKRAGAVEVLKTDKGSSSGGSSGGAKKKSAGKSSSSSSAKSSSKSSSGKSAGKSEKKEDKKDDKADKKEIKGDASAVLDAYKAGQKILEEGKRLVEEGKSLADAVASTFKKDENEKENKIDVQAQRGQETQPTQQEDETTPPPIFDTGVVADFSSMINENEIQSGAINAKSIEEKGKSAGNIVEFGVSTTYETEDGKEFEVEVEGVLEVSHDEKENDSKVLEQDKELPIKELQDTENDMERFW